MKNVILRPPRRTLPPTPLQDALFAATVAGIIVALALLAPVVRWAASFMWGL